MLCRSRAMLAAIAVAVVIAVVSAGVPTQAANGPVEVAKKLIDSPLDDIQWADSQTLFVLSERGVLYRSNTGGRGWVNQESKLQSASGKPTIRSMHISRVDPRKIFFLGHGSENFVTEDMGATYRPTAELDAHEVKMHPRQSKWLLAGSMSSGCKLEPKSDCYKTLYVSKDFGASWHLSATYAVQFDWAPTENSTSPRVTPLHADVVIADREPKSPEALRFSDPAPLAEDDLVYATVHSVKRGNQKFGQWDKDIHFYQTFDYFRTQVEVVKHGNRFLFGEHGYLFIAAVNPFQETEVSLQVSRDRGASRTFQPAVLPVDLTEHSYTILDTSEGTVFLHVNHQPFDSNAPTGHVYISDWSGTKFSLSLPYNHRSPDGKCDFEKVDGLEGVYLANFVDETEEEKTDETDPMLEEWEDEGASLHGAHGASHVNRMHTKTVITFDKGGIWSYLQHPAVDASGKPINCNAKCHLHLHGITDLYGPFYSSATATGLIMSTGTVGEYLQESQNRINTYLSRDAGLTWFEVAHGSHIYEFGDHGGLIVMAYDEGETKDLLYSWDQGITWKTVRLSDQPLQVENIIIEPEATSQRFVVYGWQDNAGLLVYVDFSELHTRTCQGHDAADTAGSDYETWSPSDGRLGGKCLLGHRVTYTRRKREAQCFAPELHERRVEHEHCPCTEEDFECDYGYYREIDFGECKKDPEAHPLREEPCHDFYYVTRGYRKVAGDTCVNGDKWERTQIPCPSWLGGSHIGKAVLIFLVLVVLSLAVVTGAQKFEFLEDALDWLKRTLQGRGGGGDYLLVGGKNEPEPHSAVDDDFLDGDEFGTSAHLIGGASGSAHQRATAGTSSFRPGGASSSRGGLSDLEGGSHHEPLRPLPERASARPTEVPRLSGPIGSAAVDRSADLSLDFARE